jgi:hypothetical protein
MTTLTPKPSGILGQATWEPVHAGQSSLTDTGDRFVLRVGAVTFSASDDVNTLGVLVFAYGLDNELFRGADLMSEVRRWLIWHVCALLSRYADDPGLPALLEKALAGAGMLAPNQAVWSEVLDRVQSRLEAIGRHHGKAHPCLAIAALAGRRDTEPWGGAGERST